MAASLGEAKTNEDAAIAAFEELKAAKAKEIEALQASLESKMTRVGDLAVKTAEMENDLEDTREDLAESKKFLADLDVNCENKKKEWAAYQKMQGEELLALADTIKVLNDDDALELFKKTLPGSASLLQVKVTAKEMKQMALATLQGVKGKVGIDLIALALKGKKVSMEKATEETKEAIATLGDEIVALTKGIKDLDKQVAEATETRKEEHEDYVVELAANNAAVELLGFAKNRLNKFYNPKMYKAAPKRELTEEERVTLNMGGTLAPTEAPGGIAGTGIGFVQVKSETDESGAPPPA